MNAVRHGLGMTSPKARARLIQKLAARGISDPAVLEAIEATSRHLFIDEALASRAYEDDALPIGEGQTISQPYIVALMTQECLRGRKVDKVLEVGTGSGYQAAVLAHLVPRVYTLERIAALLRTARRRFHTLGLNNIHTRCADGAKGWPEQAPFDGIIVTCACPEPPPALLAQLALGARLVAPVGGPGHQRLVCITRTARGHSEQDLGAVLFVPMLPDVRRHDAPRDDRPRNATGTRH